MISTLALAIAATLPAPKSIAVDTILREMTDLRLLAQRPDPWYRYYQWTSYDRASDNWKDPFANGDAGRFIRNENIEGRNERVMADVKGPGAMVRLWSANPEGTIRFYFDGETKPRLEANMADLLSGKHPLFPDPYAYVAARGWNLYFPMPYAKGLKVTWEGDPKVAIYYAVGTREYVPGTRVTTFDPKRLSSYRSEQSQTAKAMVPEDKPVTLTGGTLVPRGTMQMAVTAQNGSELRDFQIQLGTKDDKEKPWEDPSRIHNLMRKLRLRMSFDGEQTVDVPLGDFFGSAMGVTPYESLPFSVKADGTMIARWSMPFRKEARIWIVNDNALPVELKMGARQDKRKFDAGTYLFHAGWNAQTRMTRPMYDFTFADIKGEGRMVGTSLAVSNPVSAWWGEGDEKVYVDGETFPSLFGTGTEDYFGYAWCDPTPFTRPYHCQPPTQNLGNLGQTQNSRYLIVDDITFKKGLKFDMEAWHWADVKATYATTAYWYALPGTTLPEAPAASELMIPDAPLPKPVEGAIEGEKLTWSITGGAKENQGGFGELSGGQQFWWRDPAVGSVATTNFRVPAAGRYEVFANLGHARDYGRFRVTVGNNPPKEIDVYQPTLEWKRVSLGTFDLRQGDLPVKFEVLSANSASDPGKNMLGVDYFLLEKR
ncbi:DUF2961 domain-containing protein [bacterium]|nr:MAG: DUF2961 domain-containing protein [bacterium]